MHEPLHLSAADAGNEPQPHSLAYRLRRGRNWFFLGLMYAAYYTCRYNYSTVKAKIGDEFHFSKAQLGQIDSGRDLGYAFGTFANGLLSDTLGGKQSMAIGALGTILLNLAFFWYSGLQLQDAGMVLSGFVIIRIIDGYMQSFGSPGMVKINASWFQRRERGKFAGVFGAMIQLGQVAVIQGSGLLLAGFSLPIFGWTLLTVAPQNWRTLFWLPPILTGIVLVCMWLAVRNHPEDAGFQIEHADDDHAANHRERLPIGKVFVTIAGNPLVWISAGAYFCTGFVRRAYDSWWAVYMRDAWHVDENSREYYWLGWLLPLAAVVGSFSAGWISDTFFRSRRSPVAVGLYGIETIVILGSAWILTQPMLASSWAAVACLTLISLTCNSSHSIIGTAVAMDIGGRKMSGFALGVVNSFQYFGAILAGRGLGEVIDYAQKHWGMAAGWNAQFYAMAPFSLLGCLLMLSVVIYTRGRNVRGS